MTHNKKEMLLTQAFLVVSLPSNILMGDKCVSIIKSKGSKNIYL